MNAMQVPESQEQQRQVLKQLADEHRSGPSGPEIEKILSSRLPLADKIRQIDSLVQNSGAAGGAAFTEAAAAALDAGAAAPAANQAPQSATAAEGAVSKQDHPEQKSDKPASPDDIVRNRREIKKKIEPIGVFTYLFGDMWKVIPWIREKHVLVGKFFFLSIRMNPLTLQDFATRFAKQIAQPLAEVLRPICQRGWHYLKKAEYNILSLLREMAELVLAIDFAGLDPEDKNLVRHIAPLEQAYLSFVAISPDLDIVSNALRLSYRNQPDIPGSLGNTAALVQKLLEDDETIGLGALVRGMNIVATRRYLEISDIIDEEHGQLLDDTDFDCPDHIQTEIRYAVKEFESELGRLCTRRDQLLRAKNEGDRTGNNFDDFALFYDLEDDLAAQARDMLNPKKRGLKRNPLDSRGLEEDRNLPLLFSLHFFRKFLKTISPIFVSGIKVGVYPVQLFHIDLFKAHVDAMEARLPVLAKLAEANPGYPMVRYIQSRKANPESLGEADKEVLSAVSLMLTETELMLSKLKTILKKHRPGNPAAQVSPIHTRQLSSVTLTIPRSMDTIDDHEFFMGKTIAEMLSQTADIMTSFLSCFATTEQDETDELQKTVSEILRVSADLARMTTPDHYQQLRRKFQIT